MGLVAFEISWVKTPFHLNANHPQPLNQFTRVSRQDAHCGVLFCTFNPDFDIMPPDGAHTLDLKSKHLNILRSSDFWPKPGLNLKIFVKKTVRSSILASISGNLNKIGLVRVVFELSLGPHNDSSTRHFWAG